MMVLYFDRVIRTTEKAVLIEANGNEHWLPKEPCKFFKQKETNNFKVEIPKWLFYKHNFNATYWNGKEVYTFHEK